MDGHNVVSLSGGKDSTALLLLALEQGVQNLSAVFADTGNEHQATYDYVRYLADETGVDIKWIRADFSRQMAGKREYIARRWAPELVAGRPEVAGHWYRNDLEGCDTEEDVPTSQRRPSRTPMNRFVGVADGVWSWMPAQREIAPLSAELAQEVVDVAVEMLQPSGNPFLDLCLWKGRFPSTKARFCTTELKVFPILAQVLEPLLADCRTQDVYSWQGVRAEESAARALLPAIDEDDRRPGLFNYRPLIAWTADQVFAMHRKHGVRPNPLYLQGMTRVGCMPCVNNRKEELAEIARRFPAEIARIARWESVVSKASKRGSATFFASITDPTVLATDAISYQTHGIARMIEWAGTARGGRQFDMLTGMDDGRACSSAYGLCE